MQTWRHSWIWSLLVTLWALVSVLLAALLILLAAPFLGGKRAFFRIAPYWPRILFWLAGIRQEVRGWEGLPEAIRTGQQPVIFMSNHESNLDPPVLIGAIPVPAVYISKKELRLVPLVGWAAAVGGTLFIDRGKRERAIRSLHEAALKIRHGKNVVIFPEGTRTRTGELGSFKKGGFVLAQDAGVPIVPLATVGGFHTLPAGSFRLRPGSYIMQFGQPVHPSDYPDRTALAEELHRRIRDLVQRAKEV